MKRKNFLGLVTTATLSMAAFFVFGSNNSPELTPLQLANIEALSDLEGFDDCESGCSTQNQGVFCCHLYVNGVEFTLRKPRETLL